MTTQELVKPLPTSGAGAAETQFSELRRREFARLDASGLAYLDYTGAALYPASLIRADSERLLAGIAGNPHSESAPSVASSSAVETARQRTLRFFDADPDEYAVVFTSNATGAMRILAEAFPFRRGSSLTLTAAGFEDGTVNFLGLPAVADGLLWLSGIGLDRVRLHVREMTAALLDRLTDLDDGVEIYGPRDGARGGIITFNVRDRNGQILHYPDVENFARQRGVAIRGGCFCNPGAAEHALAIPADRARSCLRGRYSISRFRKCLGNAPVGALRASLGIPTTVSDLDRLTEMISEVGQMR